MMDVHRLEMSLLLMENIQIFKVSLLYISESKSEIKVRFGTKYMMQKIIYSSRFDFYRFQLYLIKGIKAQFKL